MQSHIHFAVKAATSNLIHNNIGEWENNKRASIALKIGPKNKPQSQVQAKAKENTHIQSVYHTNKFVNKTSITLCAP